MKRLVIFFLIFIVILMYSNHSFSQFYTGSYQEFGKNRVQYNQYQWFTQNFQRFKIHYYQGEDKLVEYVAKASNLYLKEIEKFLDFKLIDKIEIIVYGTQRDFRQSNIGLTNEESGNIGGKNTIIGNKMFIYYEGNHEQLNEQIKAGIAQVMMNKIMFGKNWKDIIKSNALSSFPNWFVKGFVSYISKGWNAEIESKVKDGILTKKYNDFSKLEGEDGILAGHALWNYIEENFGKDMIPVILQYTKVTHNINKGFRFAIGSNSQQLFVLLKNYYKNRYLEDLKNQSEIKGDFLNFKSKKNRIYSQVKLSPNGDKVAFVSNYWGRYKIWLYSLATKKLEKIYQAEPKLNRILDKSYPILEWHPTGNAIIFANERRGKLNYNIYSLKDKSITTRQLGVDKILSLNFRPDGKQVVMSASIMGQTNIFLLNTKSFKLTKITDDFYDDLTPSYSKNGRNIIFSSNRQNDTLPKKFKQPKIIPLETNYDLFEFELKNLNKHLKVLNRVTKTPLISEKNPIEIDPNVYTFLSDENGLTNQFLMYQDSIISNIDTAIHYRYTNTIKPITNYVTSIIECDVRPELNEKITLLYQNERYKMVIQPLDKKIEINNFKNCFYITRKNNRLGIKKSKIKNSKSKKTTSKTPGINIDDYEFLSNKESNLEYEELIIGEEKQDSNKLLSNKSKFDTYKKPYSGMYKVNFAKDYVLVQLNNNFLSNVYQRYTGPGDVYISPSFSPMFQIGFSDLFEDYRIIGGVRIPFNLNSSEFLGSIELLKKRLDHKIIIYRQTSLQNNTLLTPSRWITYEGRYRISYPINEVMSVRATMNYRNDRKIHLAVNQNTLEKPEEYFNQTGINIEFVFDNARYLDENLWDGIKFKAFVEYLQNFDNNNPYTINIGMDGRHYLKIYKNLILVNRLAWGSSFGKQKLLYYLGAVDNWILRPNNSFNFDTKISPNENYAYQTIATPMRGFNQNIRNGNSFVVFNTELRFPLFSFFSKNPIKSDFLRHFQIVAFGDIGTAWTGPHPWHADNYFNTQIIDNKPVIIKLKNARNPIVGGFGFGLRSKIIGYFVRFDFGWGVADGKIGPSVFNISLSLDI